VSSRTLDLEGKKKAPAYDEEEERRKGSSFYIQQERFV
jgi:hypothetical protein